ncbi:hypothetical protein OH76DRAFT_384934 [Lentinus brumalis]|uniref:Fungal-type protein kinase domain-containing protein n=1 Tax=Lentinus brumalis TaxID=2498619 RepID=A0A371DV60_9APHY|nr:hypothetical protein OH76DRAFT_384934 [Polyporus brumalis]
MDMARQPSMVFWPREAADSMNIIGTMAYVFARVVDPTFPSMLCPTLRFTVSPWADDRLPLASEDTRASRGPDIFGLPYAAYMPPSTSQNTFKTSSPLQSIREHFPTILQADGLRQRQPPSIPRVDIDTIHSPAADRPGELDLRSQLKVLLEVYTSDPSLGPLLPADVEERLGSSCADASYACWPGVLTTGGWSSDAHADAIEPALQYMQLQRQSQPYLQSTLALWLTSDAITLLRSSAVDIRWHPLDRSTSAGALQTIQLLLGLTVADDRHLGVHPAIEMGEGKSPALSVEEHAAARGRKRALSDADERDQVKRVVVDPATGDGRLTCLIPSPSSICPQPAFYRFRTPLFVNLHDGESPSGRTTRYFLDYLDYDQGELWGRQTRVWCAYKEAQGDDPTISDDHRRTLQAGERVYVGPYAVKLACVDTAREDIVPVVEQRRDADSAKYLLLPDRLWLGDRVRRSSNARNLPDCDDWDGGTVVERQEAFSVSPFKRKLSHYRLALGIGYRASRHQRSIQLVRRKPTQGNIYGLLHDMDMAAAVSPNDNDISLQVGTVPYMSINVLRGRNIFPQIEDVQSLFYTLYLFPFTHGAPLAEAVYPARMTRKPAVWPQCIRDWTDGTDLWQLGNLKESFFAYEPDWLTRGFDGSVLPYWSKDSPERNTLRELLLALHDGVFWMRITSSPPILWDINWNVTAREVCDVIEAFIRAHPDL